jgi:hypothetical protein
MTLQEAYKSGRKFKLPSWTGDQCLGPQVSSITNILSIEEAISTQWYLIDEIISISIERLEGAVKEALPNGTEAMRKDVISRVLYLSNRDVTWKTK